MKFSIFILQLLFLIVFGVASVSAQALDKIETARRHLEKLKVETAIDELYSVLNDRDQLSQEQLVRTLVLLGIGELSNSRESLAKDAFQRAIELQPNLRVDSLEYLHSHLMDVFLAARTASTESQAINEISVGQMFTCLLTPEGQPYCWGQNIDGRLSIKNSQRYVVRPLPVINIGSLPFSSIKSSDYHTCALTQHGKAYCWGRNDFGQLGIGVFDEKENFRPPSPVTGEILFESISVGPEHTCALGKSGTEHAGMIYCWGNNRIPSSDEITGQLGKGGGITSRSIPAPVVGGHRWKQLGKSDGWFTCAVDEDDLAYCWGSMVMSTSVNSRVPALVSNRHRFRSVSGGVDFACGLTIDGEIWCWGLNDHGKLGAGSTSKVSDQPLKVNSSHRFISVSAGYHHACAVTEENNVFCWGQNRYGELGTGDIIDRTTPVRVAGGLKFKSISAGTFFSCGVTITEAAYCWGFYDYRVEEFNWGSILPARVRL